MNWWQALLTILLGNVIVLIPMILNAHVFKSHSGETDSIISAIQQNKFELETLEYILKTAKNQYEDRLRSESPIDLEYAHKTLLPA